MATGLDDGVAADTEGRSFRRGWLRILVTAAVAAALLAGLWLWRSWSSDWQAGADGPASPQLVRISQGMTLQAVADTLSQRNLLRHRQLFRWVARLTGADRRLQAGSYSLPAGLAPRELLNRLVSGRTVPVKVTLPEGVSAAQAAALVSEALHVSAVRFLAAADSLARAGIVQRGLIDSPSRLAALDSLVATSTGGAPRLLHWAEGYLAPDTYHFADGIDATAAALAIVELGLARIDSVRQRHCPFITEMELQPHDLVTLASIIEAEAKQDDERAMIAAVYVNRLRRGWRLEADPCIAFILNKVGQRLLYSDLQVNSPYNTYRRGGLPPGPIGNPGLLSLQAACYPDPDCQALFFVSDGRGGHVFSRTRAEHERAVSQYRRLRSEAGR